MSEYLILDTETSRLFDWNRPADAEGQPRLASIAMIIADEEMCVREATYRLICPDGWEMSGAAEQINGLSTDLLQRRGWPVQHVLDHYVFAVDRGMTIVCHNAKFDTKVMRGELRRAGLPDLFAETKTICTMEGLTRACGLQKDNGRGLKWPKLEEACQLILGRAHVGAHDALADAMACLDLLRAMKGRRLAPFENVIAA